MQKISFILIIGFLFQGCITMVAVDQINTFKNTAEHIQKENEACSFEEVLNQKPINRKRFYENRIILGASTLDMGVSAFYYTTLNSKGFMLFATGFYAYLSFAFFVIAVSEINKESELALQFSGWSQIYAEKCSEDYFI